MYCFYLYNLLNNVGVLFLQDVKMILLEHITWETYVSL